VKVTLTAKLKLAHDAAQKAVLDRVSLSYRDALNYTSQVAFGLGSQMACGVPRYVGATYKAQWTKFREHQKKQALRMEAGKKPWRFKGLDAAPKFMSRTLTYQYNKDYSFKKEGQVSLLTLNGRMVLSYEGYQKHLQAIADGAEIGAGKLWYDKPKKQYYLLVALEINVPDAQPKDHKRVVGVDVGQRYHAVSTDTHNHTEFFSGKAVNQRKDRFARVRKSLQRKGTRSATRRLVLLSGRERRFIAARNHSLASHILNAYPQAVIGLENLKDIRERTERRRSKKASKKARKVRRRRSQWSFAELQTFIAYKAPLRGSMAIRVDANYTSQMCIKCGHTSKANRPNSGLMFVCENCGYQVHSDLLGARNINMRTLAVRQDWTATGCLSYTPDVSGSEAKAVRLQRYAELRWSPDTSPRL